MRTGWVGGCPSITRSCLRPRGFLLRDWRKSGKALVVLVVIQALLQQQHEEETAAEQRYPQTEITPRSLREPSGSRPFRSGREHHPSVQRAGGGWKAVAVGFCRLAAYVSRDFRARGVSTFPLSSVGKGGTAGRGAESRGAARALKDLGAERCCLPGAAASSEKEEPVRFWSPKEQLILRRGGNPSWLVKSRLLPIPTSFRNPTEQKCRRHGSKNKAPRSRQGRPASGERPLVSRRDLGIGMFRISHHKLSSVQ